MSVLQRFFLSALLAAPLVLSVPSRAVDRPDPKHVAITLPDEIQWRKGANADTAVVQGDPNKPGIYIQLIKWHPGNMSRPHYHPEERYIYVVSGTWWIGVGPKYDPATTYPVHAGTYVVDRPNEIHWDGAK